MTTTLFASLFALGIGVVLLLWGYRAFMVLLPVFGFFAGLWLGAHAFAELFGGGFMADVTGLVVGFVTGLAFAALSYILYTVGIALVSGAMGYALGSALMAAVGIESKILVAFVGIALAVLVIVLVIGTNLQKYVVIALTAIAGANALVLSALMLLGRVAPGAVEGAANAVDPVLQDSWMWAAVWAVVAIVGLFYQVRANRVFSFSPADEVGGWGLPD